MLRRQWRYYLVVAVSLATSGCCWHSLKPLPDGLAHRGCLLHPDRLDFLYDQSYTDAQGQRRSDQAIFDRALQMIESAQQLIVLDMFLFNPMTGKLEQVYRELCEELTEALINRKLEQPTLRVVVLTDPINSVYGGMQPHHYQRLEEAQIEVIETRLDYLRDSNIWWSIPWRIFFKPFGNNRQGGWVANPFGGDPVTLRSYLALLNLKANHRKVLITDDGDQWHALVTSANPHDGSSAHSNVALVLSGAPVYELGRTEQAVANFSTEHEFEDFLPYLADLKEKKGTQDELLVQVVTEVAIADTLEYLINSARAEDAIDIVMFYLADRPIVRALKQAAKRGVQIRVILDPNKDAFGYQKNGVPNRQVAHELVSAGIKVRWASTNGEQMHSKMLLVRRRPGHGSLLLGSANFTRRNLRNFNLESNLRVEGSMTAHGLAECQEYVEQLWHNQDGKQYTVDYTVYRDRSWLRLLRYRLQEQIGLSTW